MVASDGDALGLYISVPFCRSKCTYCNFASGVYPASEHARYVDRLVADISASPAWAERMGVLLPRRVDTVYLGGGTPSLLAPELVTRLFAALRSGFDLQPDAEITVECAPGQLSDETLAALAASGVNRVSLGVQSFIDREAATSGRLHNRAIVLDDIHRLRQAGISNLNVDLIAGLASQTHASWDESLAVLAACAVPHASVYMLEVDQDSRLGREVLAHGARYHADLVPADDAIAQMYERAIAALRQAGLAQYEISNFCRPGMASRHNLRYWQRRPYLGLGLDASSMLRALKGHGFSRAEYEPNSVAALAAEGMQAVDRKFPQGLKPNFPVASLMAQLKPRPFKSNGLTEHFLNSPEDFVLRSTTSDDLAAFLLDSEPVETTWLSPAQRHEEAWFLGLRLNEGVDRSALEKEFGEEMVAPALQTVERLVEQGLLILVGNTVQLTERGRLLSNEVFQQFLVE
jgi:oxygen-independent coproporphyrinogen-3 oxidase